MRHLLLKTTVIAGLVTSLASVAASDLDSCLADNSDKKDKMTICLDQVHQSMADARKQELQKQYNQTLADINKQQDDLAKKQGQGGPTGGPSSSSATGGVTNTGPSLPVNQPATVPTNSENVPNATTTSTTTGNAASTTPTPPPADENSPPPPPEKKGVDVRPVPREKPRGVQWY